MRRSLRRIACIRLDAQRDTFQIVVLMNTLANIGGSAWDRREHRANCWHVERISDLRSGFIVPCKLASDISPARFTSFMLYSKRDIQRGDDVDSNRQ